MASPIPLPLEAGYLDLPERFFARVAPTPVDQPELVVFNAPLAEALGLDLSGQEPQALARLFSGNQLPDGVEPFAQAYAGHQFGHFTMLGDGRAHVLGERVTPDGSRFDLQLKGSGPTPYSRRGDGRAALGPMLREYLISEAMAALGIPTTRALAVVATGEAVYRETPLPGAILTRVAASHIRVGTFEFTRTTEDGSLLHALLQYTLQRHDPDLIEAENPALALLDAVMLRQITLIVHWMRVGFVHGVMNTDNMALSGETIDYGPCAFMDAYDPKTVFSSIDHGGRYAYTNQPGIALWNLARLAEALLPAIDPDPKQAVALAEQTLATFGGRYQAQWLAMMRTKLGLFGVEDDDEPLIDELLSAMHKHEADYTNTFRELGQVAPPSEGFLATEARSDWLSRWQTRRLRHADSREASRRLMHRANPAVIPRNHKVEEALDAATAGDPQPFRDLLLALQSPYDERAELRPYQDPAPASAGAYRTFCGT